MLIPILSLKGVSTGDFEEALIALLGKDAGGLSATTVGRLKDAWSEEHVRWSKRDSRRSATCTSGLMASMSRPTGLMARLILEHAQISSQALRTEAGHDH